MSTNLSGWIKKSGWLRHHCWAICASLVDRNVLRVKSGLVTASKWWLELPVHRRQQRADNGVSSPANRDAAADQLSCIYLPLSELKYPLIYMAWGCDISSIISSIISKRQCLHDGYGPPQWNWNVNAYWAAINTCNPTGPGGGIRNAEERETTQGGPLFTKVFCLCRWHQFLH